MIRPGRDQLHGTVEVDETYWGAVEEGVVGRLTEKKALVLVAAQHDGHDERDWNVTLVDTGQDAMTGARLKRVKKYLGNSSLPNFT